MTTAAEETRTHITGERQARAPEAHACAETAEPGHAHDHGHVHEHLPDVAALARRDMGRILLALCLTGFFMLAEIVGGLLSGSLALIADAGHMASDTAALGIALFAVRAALRPPDEKRSFGYHRMQVLGAFINAFSLLIIAGWIFVEAVSRLFDPVDILAVPMLTIAVLGLAVNILAFFLLHGADRDNLNIRGALWHVMGDLLGSVAAITAAIIILTTGWNLADPLLSILVVGVIMRGAAPILFESAHILLEGTPKGLHPDTIAQSLVGDVEAVENIHHVHIWSLDGRQAIITLHARIAAAADSAEVLHEIKTLLRDRFDLTHATVQLEKFPCPEGAADIIPQACNRFSD